MNAPDKNIPMETIEKVFRYVVNRGFPYYQYTLKQKHDEIEKIKRYDLNKIIVDKTVRQTMHGLGLCWSYFNHSWSIRSKNFKTPKEVWDNEVLLRKAIERRLKRGGLSMIQENGHMTDAQIRKAVKSFSGVQAVSNFRPTAAAAIYRKYSGSGIVWDMSAGFGGRLLGAIISDTVKKYIATDPSTKTSNGLVKMANELKPDKMEIEIFKIGSENFVPKEKVDLCFTSPPYYDTEEYSNEATQSYKSYNTIDSWNEKFLKKTITNTGKCLKKNGFLILNIANVNTHSNLEQDTVSIAKAEKFSLVDTLKMQLSAVSSGYKIEPIFIFKKE